MKKLNSLWMVFAVMLVLGFQVLSAQQTVLETFEVSADVPIWMNANEDAPQPEIVANPNKSGINPSDSVMLWIKGKDAAVYAAAMTELQAYNVEFNGDATFIHVKMMKDNTDPCAFQVIRTDDGVSEAGKYPNPPPRLPCPTVNEWVDYVFDFSAAEATNYSWSRFYFMAVMNSTEEDGWTVDPLDNDVNVYFDEIVIDNVSTPYDSPLTTVFMDKTGQISYILNNPVTSELVLEGIGKVRSIRLFSINGKLVKQVKIDNHDAYRIPVADLGSGLYLVEFMKEDGSVDVSKIIKK